MVRKGNEGVGAPSAKEYYINNINNNVLFIVFDNGETCKINLLEHASVFAEDHGIPFEVARQMIPIGIEKICFEGDFEGFDEHVAQFGIYSDQQIQMLHYYFRKLLYENKNISPIPDYFRTTNIEKDPITHEIIEETIEHVSEIESLLKRPISNRIHNFDARQQGSGKTYAMIQKINENVEGKDLVIGLEHKVLDEIASKITKPNIVLKGFSSICARYHEQSKEGQIIRELYETNDVEKIPNKNICQYMGCSCEYSTQFTEARNEGVTVLMPVNFLHIFELNEFDRIFVEENIFGNNFKMKWNRSYLISEIAKLRHVDDFQIKAKLKTIKLKHKLAEDIRNKNQGSLSIYAEEYKQMINKNNERWIGVAGQVKDIKGFKKGFCNLKIDNLILYLEISQRDEKEKLIRDGHIDFDYQMLLFYKQMHHDRDIQYNCARENLVKNEFLNQLKIFEYLFPHYHGIMNITYSNKTRKTSKLIKHGKAGWYRTDYASYFANRGSEIENLIKYQKYKKNKKVFILTYMENVVDGKYLGCDAIYFGAAHGLNKFEKYDVLIVIGTFLPSPDGYMKNRLKYFIEEAVDFNDEKMYVKFSNGMKVPKHPIDYAYFMSYQDDVRDSVHRARALNHDVEIHWFGNNIPKKLLEEMSYKEV